MRTCVWKLNSDREREDLTPLTLGTAIPTINYYAADGAAAATAAAAAAAAAAACKQV